MPDQLHERRTQEPARPPQGQDQHHHHEGDERHRVEREDGAVRVEEPGRVQAQVPGQRHPGAPVTAHRGQEDHHEQGQEGSPPHRDVPDRRDRLDAAVRAAGVGLGSHLLLGGPVEGRGTDLQQPPDRLRLVRVARVEAHVEAVHAQVVLEQAVERVREPGPRHRAVQCALVRRPRAVVAAGAEEPREPAGQVDEERHRHQPQEVTDATGDRALQEPRPGAHPLQRQGVPHHHEDPDHRQEVEAGPLDRAGQT